MRNKIWRGAILTILGGLLITAVVACTEYKAQSDNQSKDQAITQAYYQKLSEAVPYPLEQMTDSIERRNLREKLLRFNKPDKIGYLYEISNSGEVIGFYTVKGKVSSTQSQMTVTDQHQYICSLKPFQDQNKPLDPKDPNSYNCDWATTASPADDGSYGANEDGIFWFDTNDVYHTWNGLYHYADAPIKIDSVTHKMEGVEDGAHPSSVGEDPNQRGGTTTTEAPK